MGEALLAQPRSGLWQFEMVEVKAPRSINHPPTVLDLSRVEKAGIKDAINLTQSA